MRAALILALGLLLLAPGCLDNVPIVGNDDPELTLPTWQVGRYWRYTVTTPEIDTVSTMTVAAIEGENYMVGAGTLLDARRHAVLNHNPALGRVRRDSFALYEKGNPETLLAFPLSEGKRWNFALFGIPTFAALVTDIDDRRATVDAVAPGGETLHYTYLQSARWIERLTYRNHQGEILLDLQLIEHGGGYSGNAYFLRAGDLYDGDYTGPEQTIYDTYFDEGHPKYGPWDYLVYYLEAEMPSGASGELVVRDHTGSNALTRLYGPGDTEASLGTINSVSGNWTVALNLNGAAHVRLRVAGSIEYSWTL